LCRISATGLINGGFVQRNVDTISRLRGADPASRNASSAATSIGYSQTPRRKLLRATIRGNWRKRALQRIGGRPRSTARIRVESPNVRFGSKDDVCVAKGHVRSTPESDIKCDMWGSLLAKSGRPGTPAWLTPLGRGACRNKPSLWPEITRQPRRRP
jgi:hypothetical protein